MKLKKNVMNYNPIGGIDMAKVDSIIFCLRTINMGEQGVSANIILSTITPEYVPGLFSFSVIISLLDLDSCGEHTCSIELKDPDDMVVASIENQPLPVLPPEISNLPIEYQGINIAVDWNNVNFRTSGLYTTVVLYDECEIGRKQIYVKGKNE